jgi:hypothetical protein
MEVSEMSLKHPNILSEEERFDCPFQQDMCKKNECMQWVRLIDEDGVELGGHCVFMRQFQRANEIEERVQAIQDSLTSLIGIIIFAFIIFMLAFLFAGSIQIPAMPPL